MATQIPTTQKDPYRTSRISYIIEAAVEYFISLLITDAFLAALLTRTGVSDAVSGPVTQLTALACAAQLFSVFFRKTKGVKRFVTTLHLVNQLMFVFLYFIPGINLPGGVKVAIFAVMFLGGHLIANVAQPYKLIWLMSHVPDKSRGIFTANKEIISLIGGMIFSFVMGGIVDHYEAIGKEDVGFTLCGITIFVLAILHLITLLFVKEKPEQHSDNEKVSFVGALKKTFSNASLFKIILVNIMWHVCTGISVAFYGVYKTNDLGFSLSLVAALVAVRSMARMLFSRFFGRIADKISWAKMLAICFAIAAAAFVVNTFCTPTEAGFSLTIPKPFGSDNLFDAFIPLCAIVYAVFECLYGICMAGINSGLMNIIFDYVPHEDRAAALGVNYSVGGFVSFAVSLVGAVIVDRIQGAGNTLFGMEIYAQQVLSLISAIMCVFLVVYIVTVIFKLKKEDY